jgi:hypothetical protein
MKDINNIRNIIILVCFSIIILFIQYVLNKNTKFHYITVATKPHPVLDKLLDKSHSYGEEITVLGLKENRDIGWKGGANFGIKLREVHKFLQRKNLDKNDIVLFSDAYDVVQIGSQKEIRKRFLTFNKPIVFGAEIGCHPDKDRATDYGLILPGVVFPYLNSGLFIGRVWALRKCFSGYSYKDAEDDQRFWTTQYLKRRDLIELDHHARLFLNCAFVDDKEIDYNNHSKIVTYSKTQTHPLMVHANGHDKSFLYQFIGRWNEPPKG